MNVVQIESLDHEGRGVARINGKALFIEGALPGEQVTYRTYRNKPTYEIAEVEQIVRSSFVRVEPHCRHFGVCGGCNMQHTDFYVQVAVKQRILEDNLWHIGKVKAETMMRPIYGPAWGYRRRARLSVRHVEKKCRVLIGFHEKRSSFVADMEVCEVLPPRISMLIKPFSELIASLSIYQRIPQIELAAVDHRPVFVLRILESLCAEDEEKLKCFADQHQIQFYLQPKGPDTVYPFYPSTNEADLFYTLPEFNVRIQFKPTDFTQVNFAINEILVAKAVKLLDPQPEEHILDLFCGLGNFTLPIARSGTQVVGVEGSRELVKRAEHNAQLNSLHTNAKFYSANLFEETDLGKYGRFEKMLIDPPREGAIEIVKALEQLPKRIVYVSCNPSTLARDAAVLVQTKGYRLIAAGVVNMFPHTAHVESIAVFEQ
jgi:23S rRNA (uracil1939-C5)-methyltransferase